MNSNALIEISQLSKIYGSGELEVRALDSVSFKIRPGEFVAIMGPSGSGKSTLMNLLGCLDRPTSGMYRLAGEDVSQLDKVKLAIIRNRRIGFIFQSFNLLARTSAIQNVMLPLLYQRGNQVMSPDQRYAKALDALTAVSLENRIHHEPTELSGGQQQRVAIARALVNDPVLIMADEPTGNLDTQTSDEIMALLHSLHKRGRTIVMVTHDDEVASQTERIIRLRDGQIESDQRWSKDASDK